LGIKESFVENSIFTDTINKTSKHNEISLKNTSKVSGKVCGKSTFRKKF